MIDPRELLRWTAWRPLAGAGRDPQIPRSPGLYRIRRVGREDLDYIGQTGVHLRHRLGMLSGIYKEAMPYRDPHTAAPALWALRHTSGCDFEVSVAPVEGSGPWRKGLEAVAIALYRFEHGHSPTVEFGRMPVGYLLSSSRNARLAAAGKQFRGGPWEERNTSHEPGIAPVGACVGDPQNERWGGHLWTAWTPLVGISTTAYDRGSGLYRLRGAAPGHLLYIGQGAIPNRPLAHLAKTRDANHAQGQVFASQRQLDCSWTINDAWLPHQRLELEIDLIAGHVLETGTIPEAQFLG